MEKAAVDTTVINDNNQVKEGEAGLAADDELPSPRGVYWELLEK